MNLETPASELPLVGPVYVSRLKRLEIYTIGDLLHHVPSRYLDFRVVSKIKDSTGEIEAIWFNQPFLVRNLPEGTIVSLAGKVDWFGRKKAIISPTYEKILENKKPIHTGRLVPVYPETSGISSKWLRGKISFGYDQVQNNIEENLPPSTLKNLDLVGLSSAINSVHFPKTYQEEVRRCRGKRKNGTKINLVLD